MNNTQFDWIREIQDVSNRLKEYFENLEKSAPRGNGQRTQQQPPQPPQRSGPSGGSMPADVFSDGANVIVEIEAPGLRKEDLKIEFSNATLEVSGEKKFNRASGVRTYRQERVYGAFRKQITFPADLDVDVERISASYHDGLLRITLPQRGASEQKISITIE